jgi:hypothetical protein
LKFEHISPEQPYRLNPENRAQITKDNPGDTSGDMSFNVNHIPPCISPEENAEIRAQNEQLRRSVDTGDICLQHIIAITVTIAQFFILWNIDHLCIFSSTFCFQDPSNKHNSKAHAYVDRFPFRT